MPWFETHSSKSTGVLSVRSNLQPGDLSIAPSYRGPPQDGAAHANKVLLAPTPLKRYPDYI